MAKIDIDGRITLNEFDLHDWVVGLLHTHNIDGQPSNEDGMGTFFCDIDLQPIGYGNKKEGGHIVIDENDRAILEGAANKLLQSISNFDTLLHDLCEYSC
jgi:hypothetical protein